MTFEELCTLEKNNVLEKTKAIEPEIIVKAYMGTSPENASWMKSVYTDIDFESARLKMGRITVCDVERAQEFILMNVIDN